MSEVFIPQTREATVRQNGTRVDIICGSMAISLPHKAAVELATAIMAQARRASTLDEIDRVIEDEAILIASGAPLSFFGAGTVAQREAAKAAAWETRYRRIKPTGFGGIRSGAKLGRPRLVKRGLAGGQQKLGARGIPTGEKMGRIGGR